MKRNKQRSFADLIAQGFHSGHLRRTARLLVLAGATLSLAPSVKAEETRGEKIEAGAKDAKTTVKKKGRKLKKKIRDATGNESIVEDVKDGAKNLKDDASDKIDETKNRID